MIIEVKDIRRTFRSTRKDEGMKGAFKLLVKPQYQYHEALKGVSFSLEPGSFTGLIGANGAGKTTFAREFLPHEANCPNFINADLIAAGLSPFRPESAAFRISSVAFDFTGTRARLSWP